MSEPWFFYIISNKNWCNLRSKSTNTNQKLFDRVPGPCTGQFLVICPNSEMSEIMRNE